VDEREFVVLFQLVAKGKVAGLGKKSLFGSSKKVRFSRVAPLSCAAITLAGFYASVPVLSEFYARAQAAFKKTVSGSAAHAGSDLTPAEVRGLSTAGLVPRTARTHVQSPQRPLLKVQAKYQAFLDAHCAGKAAMDPATFQVRRNGTSGAAHDFASLLSHRVFVCFFVVVFFYFSIFFAIMTLTF